LSWSRSLRGKFKGMGLAAGEFAETVREQFLEERMEYFKEVQRLLYVEALNEDAASKANLVLALCKCDPELGEKQVGFLSQSGRKVL